MDVEGTSKANGMRPQDLELEQLQAGTRQALSSPDSVELLADDMVKSCEPVVVCENDLTPLDLTRSKFAGVIFAETHESYAWDTEIECNYYVATKAFTPDRNDTIGLFRVGWQTVDECRVKRPCGESESVKADQHKLTFKTGDVLREGEVMPLRGDFFQFCYIHNETEIYGASCPFRILGCDDIADDGAESCNDDEEEFVEIDRQENDFVVVTSHCDVLQQEVKEAKTLNAVMNLNVKGMEREILKLKDEMQLKEEAMEQLKLELQSEKMHCETVTVEKNKSAKERKDLWDQCQEWKREADRTKLETEKLRRGELDYMDKIKYNAMRKDYVVTVDKLAESMKEVASLRSKVEDNEAVIDMLEMNKKLTIDELKRLECERDIACEELSLMMKENEKLHAVTAKDKAEYEATVEELKMRLKKAAEEYEERYKYSVKVEGRLSRLQSKLEKWQQTKSQETEATLSVTPVEEMTSSVDDVVVLPCLTCEEAVLCRVKDLTPMIRHVEESHCQHMCPVCSQMFDGKMPNVDKYMRFHVEDHFNRSRYPHKN